MKLSLFIFIITGIYAPSVLGLRDSFGTSFNLLPGKPCTAQTPACCSIASKCTLRYFVSAAWFTVQDKLSTRLACNLVCSRHFKKCVNLCKCSSRQTERESGNCKCKLSKPIILVKKLCTKKCLDAKAICAKSCTKNSCPLRAETNLNVFDVELEGSCEAVCSREKPLSTVCKITS